MKGQRERDDEDQNTAHCTHSHPINGPRTLLPLLSMFHPVPPLALPDHEPPESCAGQSPVSCQSHGPSNEPTLCNTVYSMIHGIRGTPLLASRPRQGETKEGTRALPYPTDLARAY